MEEKVEAKSLGNAREVCTEPRRSDSTRATSAGVTSTPSTADTPLTMTCSGTTATPSRSARPSGRYAVESVTTAIRLAMPGNVTLIRVGRSAHHEVDQPAGHDHHLAHRPAAQLRGNLLIGACGRLHCRLVGIGGHRDPRPDLPVHLHGHL